MWSLWSYFVTHLSTVLGVLASLVLMARLHPPRRTSQSTIAWLLGFLFLPFVAIPLYLIFGSRKFPHRAKAPKGEPPTGWSDDEVSSSPESARVLCRSGVAPPRSGCSFELLGDGEAAFSRLLALVGEAKETIDLTIFILGHDETGRAIVGALADRAKRGIRVRVILDAVGCARSASYAENEINAAGGEVRRFMPFWHSPIRGRNNLRSHRKLVVFDRRTVFCGGMNLADEYMGAGPYQGPGPRWRDVAAIVRGPIAKDAEAMFESDWTFVGGRQRHETPPPEVPAHGSEIAEVVPSGPDAPTDTVHDLFLSVIGRARERIVVVTPYYVPDDELQHALVLSARRGVKTELVVPSVSNHGLADVARRSLLRELATNRVVVHYYPLGMIHAKALVVDDSFAYVGSPNFDMRSLFLNYENAMCVYTSGAIAQIRAYAEALIAQSTNVGPQGRSLLAVEEIARFLSPEL
jgi:cardiolipin synthase